jgi:hypothetical protein
METAVQGHQLAHWGGQLGCCPSNRLLAAATAALAVDAVLAQPFSIPLRSSRGARDCQSSRLIGRTRLRGVRTRAKSIGNPPTQNVPPYRGVGNGPDSVQ